MSIDIDRVQIGYAVAALALVAAAVVLVRTVFFDLSITVRSAVLLAAFLIPFVVAFATGWSIDLLVLATYLGFAAYTLWVHPFPPQLELMLPMAAVILAVAVAYVLHERRYSMSTERAKVAVVAVLLVTTVLVGIDLQVGTVTYEVTVDGEAAIHPDRGDQRVVVGTATATAESPFREPVSYPDATACVYTPAENGTRLTRPVLYSDTRAQPSAPPGGSTSARLTVPMTDGEVQTAGETITVDLADSCPSESDEDRIVVVVDGLD